jgi:predicted CXXCH cytochrome family protein
MMIRALIGSLLILGGLAAPPDAAAQMPEWSCVTCHSTFGDSPLGRPVQTYAEDVHAAKGFSCVACHGGDAEDPGLSAMDPAEGYVGAPERDEVVLLCGRCHSSAQFMRRYNPALRVDQVAEYRTSVHGQGLLERGDERVATCIGCHPAHSIKPPADPNSSVNPLNVAETCGACHSDPEYMAPYAVPTDQHDKYSESVHWQMISVEGDLSAPTCNDCHGNHGAAPPGVGWVGNICGQCHSVMAEQFDESFHAEVFAMLGNPGCATCHQNHGIGRAGDDLLGLGEGAVCVMCHSEGDTGGDVASGMRALIDSLRTQYEAADSILAEAENAGIEVSEALFGLNEATTALVSARTAVHSFSLDSVAEEVEAGLAVTSAAIASGEEALGEFLVRRLGLAISVALILALIVGLVLKIRKVEQAT